MREGTKNQTRTIREIESPANLGEASESRVELSQKDDSLFFVTVNVEIITKVSLPMCHKGIRGNCGPKINHPVH